MPPASGTKASLVERVIASLNDFPMSRAEVIPAVMALTANPRSAPAELSRAIANDPALTATVLRLSNSSFYGRVRSVSSLKEAVMVLGVSLLRSLIVATSVSSLFRSRHDDLEDILWRHSLATAIGARTISSHLKAGREEQVFLAGLVHDLAQLILLQRFTDEYHPVLESLKGSGADQVEVERERLGVSHVVLGAVILEEWNFPTHLTAIVRHHHAPETVPADAAENIRRMAHMVRCADLLADRLGHGFPDGDGADAALQRSVDALGLTADSIAVITEEIIVRFEEEHSLFKG